MTVNIFSHTHSNFQVAFYSMESVSKNLKWLTHKRHNEDNQTVCNDVFKVLSL